MDIYLIRDEETEEEYLSKRASKYMDVMFNGAEYPDADCAELVYKTKEQQEFLKNYIYDFVDPAVRAAARMNCSKYIRYDDLYSELSVYVFKNLYKYNNERYHLGTDTRLSTFIKSHVKRAVTMCIATNRGIPKRLIDFERTYNKARNMAGADLNIKPEDVKIEVVVEYMNRLVVEQYTIERVEKLIKTLELYEGNVYIDENISLPGVTSFEIDENEFIDMKLEADLRKLFLELDEIKKFLLLYMLEYCNQRYRVDVVKLCRLPEIAGFIETDRIGRKHIQVVKDISGMCVKVVDKSFINNQKMLIKKKLKVFFQEEYPYYDLEYMRGKLVFLAEYWPAMETTLKRHLQRKG